MQASVSEKQYQRMLTTPIPKLVVSMAVPTVISMLITVIYNTADTYFVSQINKSASAAVGAIYPIMAIIQAAGYGLGMGSSSLISRLLGQKKNDQANLYASCAFFLSFFLGGLVTAICLPILTPLLKLLGCSETMLPYAQPYAVYILAAAPISCSTFVLNNALRAQGASKLAMWGMGAGGVLNMILDPILIFSCDMGAGGAALATAISQCVSFLIFLVVFLRGKSIIKIHPKYLSKNGRDYFQILATGFPTICRQSFGSLSSALLNIQAVVYGDAAVSAITIANKVYILTRNIVLGIGQGFQPVAGYNFGAGDRKRTWKAFRFTSLLGSVVCIVTSVVIIFFAAPIMTWFSKDPDVISIGIATLYFCGAVTPFMAISTYINMLYQCLGFKAIATFLASCRQGILFVPSILLLPIVFHLQGVEASQPLADLLTFVISIPFLIHFYRKEIRGALKS